MKAVVVIPTFDRKTITTVNIKTILPYAKIVLVVSTEEERAYYSQFPITIVSHQNRPLGQKFMCGILKARELDHDCIIVNGSDDLLSVRFLSKIIPASRHISFTGLRSWFIYHQGKLYWLDYMAAESLPLGSGRIYSREFLEKVDYQIFDSTKNIWLDNFGWKKAAEDGDFLLLHSPEILAVKGDWSMLNKFNPKHKNVNIRAEYSGWKAKEIMKEKFGYEVPPDPPKVYHLR